MHFASPLRGVRWPVLIAAAAVAITALLYARSLALPFYSDDLVQLPWLRDLSLPELWSRVSPYGYYRPLAFSAWLLIRDLGLPWTPAGLRLINLVAHALASGLAGWLAADVDPEHRPLAGIFTAALFAAYPFAYQAVPWVSAIFYPLVVALTILAVLAYRRARRTGSWRWMGLSLIAAALAPFAHENGMLVGLLVLLSELSSALERDANQRRKISLWPVAHLALNAAFLILWFALRQGGVSTLDFSVAGLFQNGAVLASGLSYPFIWLARIEPFRQPPLHAVAIAVLSIVSMGILVWSLRRIPAAAMFGLGWFVLSLGPVLVTMRPAWLLDAPRFLYPAGVGAALLWGLALSRLGGASLRSTLIASSAAILLILPGVWFVHQGLGWHLRGGAAVWDAVRAAQAHPGAALLMVNLPDRLSPPASFYPYFDGGAILLPAQVSAPDIVGAHTGEPRTADRAATVGEILPPVDYPRATYGPLIERPALAGLIPDRVLLVADYSSGQVHLREAGRVVQSDLPGPSAIAYFENILVLWNAESSVEEGLLKLTLLWELPTAPQGAPTIFVHVVDAAGALVAQADGDPLAGLYPLSPWQGYAMLEDIRYVRLPGQGPYTVYVGVWEPATGEKLSASGGDYPDDRVPVAAVNP